MTRLTPRLILMGALLSPATLYALGLGEIRLNSALNQPLDAEIELIAPTQDELTSLRVALANNETFARYGLDRPQFLSALRFEVGRGREGASVIKVTSNRSITEPFVTLLVEASWARGRLLREYTVLLDPPVFMPGESEAPAVVQAPKSGTQSEGRIERAPPARTEPATPPVAAEPPPAPAAQPRAETPAPVAPPAAESSDAAIAPGSSYTVQRNDTLYEIASVVRPGSRRVVNQTMIALYRANPEAFAGTIHRLKAGSVLRIPDSGDIESLDAGEASSEVARQTEEWRAGSEEGRLQLVAPTETGPEQTAKAPEAAAPARAEPTGPARAPTPPPSQPVQPEAQAPAPAAPTAAPAPQRPVAVPDAGLAQMQERLAAEQAAKTPEAQPAPAQPPAAQPRPATPPAVSPPVEDTGLIATLKDYWWAVLALLAAIAALVFVARRRHADADGGAESFATLNYEPPVRSSPTISPARDIPDNFGMNEGEDYEEPGIAAAPERTRAVEASAARPPEDTLSSETAVQFDQQDALAEADFHMAYGLYDQAADLVKIAIEREPARRDLKLKLLEIYFVWGNKDLFLETARGLYDTRGEASGGEWDKVVIMGRQIAPEESMFQDDGLPHALDSVDVNLEGGENRVDIDLFGEPEGEQGKDLDIEFGSAERAAVKTGSGGSLDFLLDEPSRGADDEPTRELDPLSHTQETPTIESPMIDRGAGRGQGQFRANQNTEQTAELSLDDLGLDVNSLESTGSLEETTSIEDASTREMEAPTREMEAMNALRDDEMTQLAPSLGSLERTMEAPGGRFDNDSTGTIFIDQVDLTGGGDTLEQRKPDLDSTASLKMPPVDVDLDDLDGLGLDDGLTVRQTRREETDEDRFSSEVFDLSAEASDDKLDLDVGESFNLDQSGATNTQAMTAEMDLAEEMDPVTMSEVGTKLDLARAYMDMGDPDGARSILEEVLEEGNPNQKQEAQRLLEAVR
jgi:pilus assembly protein FimV